MPPGDAGLERQPMHEGMGPPYAVPREWLVQAERERDKLRAQLAAQQAVVDAARQAVGGSMGGYVALREALRALDKAQVAQPEGERG